MEFLQTVINRFGKAHQVLKAIEELAELSVELSKQLSEGERPILGIIEEIADVQIMLDQLKIIFGSQEVDTMIRFKLDRLRKRINA